MIVHLNKLIQELIQVLMNLGIYKEGSVHFNERYISFNRLIADMTSPTRKSIKIFLEEKKDSSRYVTYSISIPIPVDTSKYASIPNVIERTIETLQQNSDISNEWTWISQKPTQVNMLLSKSFSYTEPSIMERQLQKSIIDGDIIALKVLETLIWA